MQIEFMTFNCVKENSAERWKGKNWKQSTFYIFSRWLDFREQRQMSECADAFEPAEEFETFCYKMLTEKMLDGKGWRGLRSHKKT